MNTLAHRSLSLTGLLLWTGIANAQSASAQSTASQPTSAQSSSTQSTSIPAALSAHQDVPADAATHAATDVAMADALREGAHMRLTPARVATSADSLRADSIAFVLRDAIERYRDVRFAEADGYRMFAPGVTQAIYHFTKWENAVRAELNFDAGRPTSLLYTRDAAGRFRLIGAMYTAPARSSADDLNARVPLGIARWHLHTDICLPRRLRDRAEWARTRNGLPLFGPASPIATVAECRSAGGRFQERVFNWMVHVNVFTSDVWNGHRH